MRFIQRKIPQITAFLFIIIIIVPGCRSEPATPEVAKPTIELPTAIPSLESTAVVDLPVYTPTEESAGEEIVLDTYEGIDPSGQDVIFWHSFEGEYETAILDIIQEFNANNPWNMTVTAIYQGTNDDLEDRMLTFMNSSEAPSLLVTNETQAATYQLGNALIDINQFIRHDTWGLDVEDQLDFYPGFINQGVFPSFDNIRLTYPIFGHMNVLFYNADWLNELGFRNPPTSPDAFQEAACLAASQPFSGSTSNGQMGYPIHLRPSTFSDWAYAFGSQLFNQSENQFTYNTSNVNAAMTFLQDLVKAGCATPMKASDLEASTQEASLNFIRGVSLFMDDSTEKIPEYRNKIRDEANFNWRITPLPYTTDKPRASVQVTGVSIPKTQPKEELAAWLFMKYLTTSEIQAQLTKLTNALSVRAGAAEFLSEYYAKNPAAQMTIELLKQSLPEPTAPGYKQVQTLSQEALSNIIDGKDITDILTQLSVDANDILNEHMAKMPKSTDKWAEVDPSGQTILFWHPHSGNRLSVLNDIINEFNATNEWGITVVPESQDGYGEIFQNLLPILGTDEAPDLVMSYQFQAGAYHKTGELVDMTSLVDSATWGLSSKEIDDFNSEIFKQDVFSIFDGVRLGIPVQRSIDVLYFNMDWLDEIGFNDPPSTPKEFKQMSCAASTPFSKSISGESLGFYFFVDSNRFSSLVFAFGGEIFDDATQRYAYNSEGVIEVVTFLLDLIESGCAVPITDRGEAQRVFSDGNLLFMIDSSFQIPSVANLVQTGAGFNWGVTAIPSKSEKPIQNAFGASISITRSTPEKELAAWQFIKYFSSPEVQAAWGQGANYLPIRKSAADTLEDYFVENPNYKIAFELLSYARTQPSVPGYDFVRQEVALALDAILNGMDVNETLEALNTTVNQILAIHIER